MNAQPDFVCRANKFAYQKWVELVRLVVRSLIFIAYVCSFLALGNEVQSVEYGVLIFCGALSVVVWLLYRFYDKYEKFRPLDYGTQNYQKARRYSIYMVVVMPIAVGWILNESFYGAINPLGYWQEELEDSTKNNCSVQQDMLTSSLEALRVTQNKYGMGIATVFEVKASIETLQLVNDFHKKCITSAESRKAKAAKRLNELKNIK